MGYKVYAHFNPRSLAGATVLLLLLGYMIIFQSTLPCGSDLISNVNKSNLIYFNPRSLAGATYDKLYDAINHDISIHAPLRERL